MLDLFVYIMNPHEMNVSGSVHLYHSVCAASSLTVASACCDVWPRNLCLCHEELALWIAFMHARGAGRLVTQRLLVIYVVCSRRSCCVTTQSLMLVHVSLDTWWVEFCRNVAVHAPLSSVVVP